MHLYSSLSLYNRSRTAWSRKDARDFQEELAGLSAGPRPRQTALEQSQQGKAANQEDLQRIAFFFRRYRRWRNMAYPMIIPPAARPAARRRGPNRRQSAWSPARRAKSARRPIFTRPMAAAFNAKQTGGIQPGVPNTASGCRKMTSIPRWRKASQEFFFNQIEPFYKSMVIYVAALLLGCLFWINLSPVVRRIGIRPAGARLCHSYHRPGLSHVPGRASAGDQSVFLGHLHRLGRRASSALFWSAFSRAASAWCAPGLSASSP